MSLEQKFTWGDFLKLNPDMKKVKRTSPEGEKAFKAAYKKFAKEHLKTRETKIKKEQERVSKVKGELVKRLQGVDGNQWHLKSKRLNKEIGRYDAYLARLSKWQEKSKQVAKKI